MSHLSAMLDRVPPPITIEEGSLVHDLLSLVDGQLQIFDEDLDRIQRSHWVGFVTDREDAGRLGSLFDVAPADWEPLTMFRERLLAEVAALLSGSVSVAQLADVTERIVGGARQSFGMPAAAAPTIVEWPRRVRHCADLQARQGRLRPHDRVDVRNRGLDPAVANVTLIGVAGGATAMPVVVNWTTGRALGWNGIVPAGRTLNISSTGGTMVRAALDGENVSAGLWSTPEFGPDVVAHPVAEPLILERGVNTMSVESLGRYDEPGTNHAAFGVVEPPLEQGRFADAADAGSTFDDSVFTTGLVCGMDIHWTERSPSAFDVVVDWGAVARLPRRRRDPEADREDLLTLLQQRIDRLRGSAVAGRVRQQRLTEQQPMYDRVTVISPQATEERASAGDDRLLATTAQFDETTRERGRLT